MIRHRVAHEEPGRSARLFPVRHPQALTVAD